MTDNSWNVPITAERIIQLHKIAIEKYQEGDIGPPRSGCIEGCIGGAKTAQCYEEETPENGLTFISYLLSYIARNHCFIDGNKRVAWMAAVDILHKMGLTVNATNEEVYLFVNSIVEENKGGREVADWLATRLVEYKK